MAALRLACVIAPGLAGTIALLAAGLPAAASEPGAAAELPRGLLSLRGVGGVKAGIACAATALTLWGLWLERRGRGRQLAGLRDAALAALALASVVAWLNLFQFHFPGIGHASDTFHYYLGAKYFPELGYTRLYACTAVADAESGRDALRPIRDLESNELTTSAAILDDPGSCKRHFEPQRWARFRADVEFLHGRVSERRWQRFQQDHGYNATPAWGVLGQLLTRTGPASTTQIAALRALDPLLLLASAVALALAFGWRVAALAVVYFGTNYAAPYGWTGGSILRYDWLAASLIGIALLRRGREATGGALLALAAALRLFPALLLAGIALGSAGRAWHQRRLVPSREERRIALGALAGGALCLALSLAVSGPASWGGFARNARTHLATPLANHVGLRTVLSHDPAMRAEVARDAGLPDPMQPWKRARRERFASRALLFGALVAGYGLLLARAAGGAPPWVGAVLGVAWIPVAAELTGYYWCVLCALALLAARHPVMGPATCALSALGWAVASHWHWTDEIHVWLSVLTVSFSVFTLLLVTPRPGRAHPERVVHNPNLGLDP